MGGGVDAYLFPCYCVSGHVYSHCDVCMIPCPVWDVSGLCVFLHSCVCLFVAHRLAGEGGRLNKDFARGEGHTHVHT